MEIVKPFYKLKDVQDIFNNATKYFEKHNQNNRGGIYNNMEGLRILSFFNDQDDSYLIIINKLNDFFENDFDRSERFNLIRHFFFIPDICKKGCEILNTKLIFQSKYDFKVKRDEILCMLIGAQTKNGSWGYYPRNLNENNLKSSKFKRTWESLSEDRKVELMNMVSNMGDHYRSKSKKSINSNIWTSFSIITLLRAEFNSNDKTIYKGIEFLLSSQNKDGGWGFNKNNPSQITATGIVLMVMFTVYSDSGELMDTFNKKLIKGIKYIVNKAIKKLYLKELREIDKGGGTELKENSIYTFSVTATIIDSFSLGIIKCRKLIQGEINLFKDMLQVLEVHINLLLQRDLHRAALWEARISFDSFRILYDELYKKQITIEKLNELPKKLFPLLTKKHDIETKKLNEIIKLPKRYPYSYLIIFLVSSIEIIAGVLTGRFTDKSYLLLTIFIGLIALIMFFASKKGVEI